MVVVGKVVEEAEFEGGGRVKKKLTPKEGDTNLWRMGNPDDVIKAATCLYAPVDRSEQRGCTE